MAVENQLRMSSLVKILGVSRSTLYAMIKAGDFPAPTKLSPRTSVWPEGVVREFVRAKAARGSECGDENARIEPLPPTASH